MKAIVLTKAKQFKLETVPDPQPTEGEALIKVKACALNRLELWAQAHLDAADLPHVYGSDVTGTIEKVVGRSDFKPGDEVIVNPSIPCGTCPSCLAEKPCDHVHIFGFNNPGGLAEFVTAPINQLYPKPKNLSWNEATAFPLTFLTAYHMLVTRAQLIKGETVFIWGVTGGLGLAALQIAKYLGAHILTATKNDQLAKSIHQLGASQVFNYTTGDLVQNVLKETKGQGVEVVFESVGEPTWKQSIGMLRPHGRVVIAGTTGGDLATQDLSDVYYHQLTILGSRMGYRVEFEQVYRLVSKSRLKPVIDSTVPLSAVPQAYQRMANHSHLGKIVVEL
jgi:NADPH:quinone reductase-like Zn-dependent oxidoreductase